MPLKKKENLVIRKRSQEKSRLAVTAAPVEVPREVHLDLQAVQTVPQAVVPLHDHHHHRRHHLHRDQDQEIRRINQRKRRRTKTRKMIPDLHSRLVQKRAVVRAMRRNKSQKSPPNLAQGLDHHDQEENLVHPLQGQLESMSGV